MGNPHLIFRSGRFISCMSLECLDHTHRISCDPWTSISAHCLVEFLDSFARTVTISGGTFAFNPLYVQRRRLSSRTECKLQVQDVTENVWPMNSPTPGSGRRRTVLRSCSSFSSLTSLPTRCSWSVNVASDCEKLFQSSCPRESRFPCARFNRISFCFEGV